MKCPSADALTTIAGALEWDARAALQHLTSCTTCAEQLQTLQVTRDAFHQTAIVGEDVVAQISQLISAEAQQENARQARRDRYANAIEALLAGLTAVVVLNGADMRISHGASAAVFAIVTTIVLAYRVFASSQASASRNSTLSIQ